MAAPPVFRRLVLEVGHGAAGPATLRGAADVARLLHLALHCVLVEDAALFDLPVLSFARELRLPTHEWRPLDAGRLADDFAAMAAGLRHNLAALGASHGIAQALEVQRGDPELCLGGLCSAGDIIVLAEAGPGWPRTHHAARLQAMAQHSAASVLLLPAVAPVTAAPVAAVLANPDDPSLAVAAGIAACAGAGLRVVLAAGDPAMVASRAASLGVPAARVTVRGADGHDPASLAAALDVAMGAARERLLVLDAAAWGADGLAAILAQARGVPVLLVETRLPVSRPG